MQKWLRGRREVEEVERSEGAQALGKLSESVVAELGLTKVNNQHAPKVP